jgi:hypothetical protein
MLISLSNGRDPADHLRAHLRAIGCTCAVVELHTRPTGVTIAHDHWCPVLIAQTYLSN